MNKADQYMFEQLNRIITTGFLDENPRPHWSDGTPAHTLSVNGNFREFNINKGEFPISSLRPLAWKTGLKEIFAIFQNQSNKVSEFERMGCKWWKDWEMEDGTIGRSYPYNMESHRPGEMQRELVKLKRPTCIVDTMEDTNIKKTCFGIGYEDKVTVKNMKKDEIDILREMWLTMLKECSEGHSEISNTWTSLNQFLNDIRYVPQYFLARENNFENWMIDPNYYGANYYSISTCAFIHKDEYNLYRELNGAEYNGIIYQDNDQFVYRYELSRNQVVELINELKTNPYGRRHIISFWHWANIHKKALVECAYETIWNVRNNNGKKYLDMTLIQRSGDSITASCCGVNEFQYTCLLMMIANCCGYEPGMFYHYVSNEQLYDRHQVQANEMLKRYNEMKKAERKGNKKPIPKIVMNKENKDFFNYTMEDFAIENYDPILPQLRFEVAI